ncbi:RNA polymerase sigma factor [Phaeocystidibacter marisrubri]|uniref:Sigma-70 family RNA polymerase sigma factor n=1 Tax=Phaeocystidibacter marisrubri TaxID=1577780 RepID=A0A6L3ZLX3_9FLAO|nr:sigma-70 family RNA polymerase sigma factor [Phaeocystidibacter marisrubri]KAB2818170.1 sigma-70 family RNA polymerase sigma factor [Phaeocystidibacter marisrubri]
MKETLSFTDLVVRCRKNDRRAQAMLYEKSFPALMKVCRRYRKQDEDARSLANSCYLKILLNLEKYDEAQPFLPWAMTVAVRACIDELRKSKTYNEQVLLSDEERPFRDDFNDSVSNDVLNTISAEEVDLVMNALPERQKLVFNMFEFEGYKHEEIGEILEISVRTSKRLLQAARETLRGRLIRRYQLKDVI